MRGLPASIELSHVGTHHLLNILERGLNVTRL